MEEKHGTKRFTDARPIGAFVGLGIVPVGFYDSL
jgi:hypothetical protein